MPHAEVVIRSRNKSHRQFKDSDGFRTTIIGPTLETVTAFSDRLKIVNEKLALIGFYMTVHSIETRRNAQAPTDGLREQGELALFAKQILENLTADEENFP